MIWSPSLCGARAGARLVTLLGAAFCVLLALASASGQPAPEAVRQLIDRAGNAEDDAERLALLQQLRDLPDLDPQLREDAERMVKVVDDWVNNPRLAYFGGAVGGKRDADLGIPETSPLYPLTYLYRGRMVVWVTLESGGIWGYQDKRGEWFASARSLFQKAAEAYPDNGIARMYLGEPIPWDKPYAAVEGAPEWAANQRVGLESLTDIIEWWIDHRMGENGEYGGGWGDDCEMWRWWVPVLIGFESEKLTRAQAFFSEAMMKQPHMAGGYTSGVYDVEHTAEDSADTITPMMHLAPDDEAWQERALRIAELMETLWTGRNERGFLQYKSTYFSSEKVDEDPRRACDTVYHPRAVQPVLLYWQRTQDPRLTKLFSAWMDTWVDAAAREENGKPAGIIPSAIHWPDGRVGGVEPEWWEPKNHGEYGLYTWPSAMSMMTNTLLLTYQITGDEKCLQPIRSMARIRMKHLAAAPTEAPAAGSEAWCAARMGFLNQTLAKLRFLTGNPEFDSLFGAGGSSYIGFRLSGDREPLLSALDSGARAFDYNWAGYTSEVRYTDRVLRFPACFQGDVVLAQPRVPLVSPQPDLLYSTATGDPGGCDYFPLNAVRWLTPPREIAALVTDSGPRRFAAELFSFGEEARPMGAELYLLAPGNYQLTLRAAEGQERLARQRVTVSGPRTRVSFDLPARTLCTLTVAKA